MEPSLVVQGERSSARNIWGRMKTGMAPRRVCQAVWINEYGI